MAITTLEIDRRRKFHNAGLRSVAVFEALKGFLVVAVGLGLLSFIHQDAEISAERLVKWLHLNPARHYPRIFIDAASNFNDSKILMVALLAATYATVRFVEAYGLWNGRTWAEWFAIVSGSIYVPVEIYSILHHATRVKTLVLIINILIVLYLCYVRYSEASPTRAGPGAP